MEFEGLSFDEELVAVGAGEHGHCGVADVACPWVDHRVALVVAAR
jgi:hypothetical protein